LAERDDLRRQYLAQQIELGGAEVVLGPAAARQGGKAAGEEAVERPGGKAAGVARLEIVASGAGASSPKWREHAPAIPGPGLTVITDLPAILGDALNDAPRLDAVTELIAACRKCTLCEGRSRTVPGEGSPEARLMLVGEGPGATEDATGRPFVGQAGQLLDKILEAIECPRPTTFIANIVKCRPPQNRKPLPDEMAACLPYLHRQIALVRPKVLIALGSTAAEGMLGVRKSLGELRNRVHRWNGIPLVVTYHPAALLRNPNWKKPTWDDVRIARQLLDS